MKKILSLIAIFALVSLMFVPLASASPVEFFDSQGTYYTDVSLRGDADAEAYPSRYVGGINAQETGYLTAVTINIKKVGSPSGFLQAEVYSTADYSLLATSTDFINSSELTTSYVDYSFTFNQTFQMVADTHYWVGVKVYNGTVDGSNYVCVPVGQHSVDNEDVYAYSCRSYYSSAWHVSNYNLLTLGVWGDDLEAGATPTPTPTPPTTGGGDADIENLTNIILPWLVPLLICLIPALLGYKFVGELGFFIGLNVGCILAYVTLASTAYAFPLWGIILVGVMDVAVVLMRR